MVDMSRKSIAPTTSSKTFPQSCTMPGKGTVSLQSMSRLSRWARCRGGTRAAVKCHNANKGSAQDLLHDLKNVPKHDFDYHQDCSNYFCRKAGFANQEALYLCLPKQVLKFIDAALEPVIKKVKPLLQHRTRNRAEAYISMITKFTSGKMLHLTGRGGHQRQVQGAALSLNWGKPRHERALQSWVPCS